MPPSVIINNLNTSQIILFANNNYKKFEKDFNHLFKVQIQIDYVSKEKIKHIVTDGLNQLFQELAKKGMNPTIYDAMVVFKEFCKDKHINPIKIITTAYKYGNTNIDVNQCFKDKQFSERGMMTRWHQITFKYCIHNSLITYKKKPSYHMLRSYYMLVTCLYYYILFLSRRALRNAILNNRTYIEESDLKFNVIYK